MKTRVTSACAALVALLAAMFAIAPQAQASHGGFHISGTQLLDANGNPFVFRGTSLPHVWFPQHFAQFGDASGLGANSARVVLGSGQQWRPNSPADVANVINECKQHQLICMLEVHDTTGFGDPAAPNAATLQQAVDYWTSPAMLDVLQGEEAYILINIGNEPWGNVGTAGWTSATIAAIQGMRTAGLTHTLVVDAPNWGQDWQFVMRDNAPQVAAADVLGNTLFSIHMYEVFGQASSIISYFDVFESMGLPLVVGEFGHFHNGQNVDEDTIMAEAQARGIGYIGWSWSGNSGGVEFLDHVNNFNPSNLTTWGQRLFLGPDGIVATAQRASVFDDGTPSPPPPPPPPGECDVRYEANDWGGHPGFTASVTITNTGESTIDGWLLEFTLPAGQTLLDSWSATWSQQGADVTATNLDWNATLAPGQATQIGFNGLADSIGNNPPPTGFALNGVDCTVG